MSASDRGLGAQKRANNPNVPSKPQTLLMFILIVQHTTYVITEHEVLAGCVLAAGVAEQVVGSECLFDGLPAAAVFTSIRGQLGRPEGPPALINRRNSSSTNGSAYKVPGSSLSLAYLVLDGFGLPDPHGPEGMIPVGLLARANSTVVLKDVRILVDKANFQLHVTYFRNLPDVRVYTDGASFLHVNWHASSRASWQSVGLLLATELQDARHTNRPSRDNFAAAAATTAAPLQDDAGHAGHPTSSGYGYVLSSNNKTLVPLLRHFGALTGPSAPVLIYVDSNVTLTKPRVPEAGILMARPLFLVGLSSANASLDFHITVNTLIMTAPDSNLTLDSVVVENQGLGDAISAEIAKPASVSSPGNFWALYYPRTEHRLSVKNCTLVLSSQDELDYYLYWATVFSSKLPYFQEQSRFVRDTMKATEWLLKDPDEGDNSVFVVRATSSAASLQDTLCTMEQMVAPRLALPPVPPSLQLKEAQKSPLVSAVTSSEGFLEHLQPLGSSEAGRLHIILLRTNVSLPTLDTNSSSSSSENHNTTNQLSNSATLATVARNLSKAGLCPVPYQTMLLGDVGSSGHGPDNEHALAVLDLGWQQELLLLPDSAAPGHLQIQHVLLRGLAQGPAAAAATQLGSPEVWTVLLWFIKRHSRNSVALSARVLEVPLQELQQLRAMAAQWSGQVVLRLDRNVWDGGQDGILVLTGVRDVATSSSSSSLELHVDSMTGHGLNCSNITLRAAAAAAAAVSPHAHFWPAGQLPNGVGSSAAAISQAATAFNIKVAVAVAVPVAVIFTAAVLTAVVWRRKQRQRRRRLQDVEKVAASGAFSFDRLLPRVRRSSEPSGPAAAAAAMACQDPLQCKARSVSAVASSGGNKDTQAGQHDQVANQQLERHPNELQPRDHGLNLLRVPTHSTLVLQDFSQVSYQPGCEAVQDECRGSSSDIGQRLATICDGQQQQQGQAQAQDQQLQSGAVLLENALSASDTRNDRHSLANNTSSSLCSPTQEQAGKLAAATSCSSSSSLCGANSEQHEQQQQLTIRSCHPPTAAAAAVPVIRAATPAAAPASPIAEAAAATAAPAGPVAAAMAVVPGGLAAPHARQQAGSSSGNAQLLLSKSWRRVSGAISLLQHDITLRRLEAGMMHSYPARAVSSGKAAAAAAAILKPGFAGHHGAAAAQHSSSEAATGRDTARSSTNENSAPDIDGSPQNSKLQHIQLLKMIGRGTFATVYRAVWRGRCVAVKVVHLPGTSNGGNGNLAAALQTRERMAVMEAVVSVTTSHPNIVQVFTFGLQPLQTSLPPLSSLATPEQRQLQQVLQQQLQLGGLHATAGGWELRLVMEYCEEGSLRHALNERRLSDSHRSLPALPIALALAHDIACAMVHLHSENLIHADLKASNVLLMKGTAPITACSSGNCLKPSSTSMASASAAGQSQTAGAVSTSADAPVNIEHDQSSSAGSNSGGYKGRSCAGLLQDQQAAQGGRLVAKVADFGLSLSLNPGDTHVSHMHAGTLTHMAPELLLHGHASSSSDVYAFGILLWALFTGGRAFLGVPVALLGYNVVHLRWRPQWPPGVPAAVQVLVEQCWAHAAAARPTFKDILIRLEQLLQLSPEQLLNLSVQVERVQQQQQHLVPAAAAAAKPGKPGPGKMDGQQQQQHLVPAAAAAAAKPGKPGPGNMDGQQQQQQQRCHVAQLQGGEQYEGYF